MQKIWGLGPGSLTLDGHRMPDPRDHRLERPWSIDWHGVPRRTAGPGFNEADYASARIRADEVACATLGETVFAMLQRDGHIDLDSKIHPGVTYRLRPGRRIEVRLVPGTISPWRYPFLCINPHYPLPENEFLAQLYLYLRDQEEAVMGVAAPQPWDQVLGRTF